MRASGNLLHLASEKALLHLLAFVGVCWRLLACVGVCHFLAFVGVWRLLAFVIICWSRTVGPILVLAFFMCLLASLRFSEK